MQLQFFYSLVGLSLLVPPITALPADTVGRQSLSGESFNDILATLEKDDMKLENGVLKKREPSANIVQRDTLSDQAIEQLVTTIKSNNINFDLGALDDRPLSEETTNALLAALENAGILVDLSILNKKQSADQPLVDRRASDPGPLSEADCNPDPATIIPKTTKFNIDDGFQIPKRDPKGKDACDTKGSNIWCWTEQWLVEAEVEFDKWTHTGFSIDCNTTKDCGRQTVGTAQTCVTHTTGHNREFHMNVDAKFEMAAPIADAKWALGVTPGFAVGDMASDSTQTCTIESGTATCTWDDDRCHSMWYAQRNMRIYGYLARVCQKQVPAKTQLTDQKNKAGNTVLGLRDFSVLMPINKHVGCAALCKDLKYPEPTPKDENGRQKFQLGKLGK